MRQRLAYGEKEAQAWARSFRGPKRLQLLALVGNVLLLAVLLAVPYLRGQARTRAAWASHDAFLDCLYGPDARSVQRSPDLAAEASLYARRALGSAGQSASQCLPLLYAVAAPEALFLLPSLKRSEQALREAVRVAASELAQLGVAPIVGAPLSQRPLRALVQLRGLLEGYSRAAGLLELPAPGRPSTQKAPLRLALPGRIPLYVGADALISLWGSDDLLHAAGLDRTGVSYVAISDHLETAARLVRPKALRDLSVMNGRLLLVWGTAPERCRELGGCAGKSTGLAQATLPLTALPAARWLAAHLSGRADRVLHVDATGTVALLAASLTGSELRHFSWSLQRERADASTDLPPLLATSTLPLEARAEVLLSDPLANSAVLSIATDAAETTLRIERGKSPPRRVSSLPPSSSSWVTACTNAARVGFAFGTEDALVLGEIAATGLTSAPPVALPLGQPIDDVSRAGDRVQRFCVQEGALATVLDRDQRLQTVFCSQSANLCKLTLIADGIDTYAALQTEAGLVLAFAGTSDRAQIRVRRTDLRGNVNGPEHTPAACWRPSGGMCGRATLAQLGRRVVLAARDGSDLSALESPDLGASWQPLHGALPSLPRELVAESLRQRSP
jgi:hypothetical protein